MATEVIGLGGICIALIGLIWKIWQDHSRVINRSSIAQQQISIALKNLDDTLKNDIKSRKTRDEKLNKLLSVSLKKVNGH